MRGNWNTGSLDYIIIVAIFYPFSQLCEIIIFLLSLQKQPNAASILFQRGVEYGEYDYPVNSASRLYIIIISLSYIYIYIYT